MRLPLQHLKNYSIGIDYGSFNLADIIIEVAPRGFVKEALQNDTCVLPFILLT
ncbi:MAG: hypothetical protein WKI04_09850 [Ferruginibacter sp.]